MRSTYGSTFGSTMGSTLMRSRRPPRAATRFMLLCLCLGFRGRNCEQNKNDCVNNRCHNGSSCVDLAEGYRCVCPPTYTGNYCDIDVNECELQPGICRNGGTCMNMDGKYLCICVLGWTGDNCAINEDDCARNPCYNGGTCHDRVGYFFCQCPRGKTGLRCHLEDACESDPCNAFEICETSPNNGDAICVCQKGRRGADCSIDINECLESTSSVVCEHGGTCFNLNGSFRCICPIGFVGRRCEMDIDECVSAPCFNDGTCLDLRGAYDCVCMPGYTGVNCELDIDECASHPCLNGGVCQDLVNRFQCDSSAAMCQWEETETPLGRLVWPDVAVNSTASLACPAGTVEGANATRLCLKDFATGLAEWSTPNVDACNITRKLAELNDTVITPDNVNSKLSQLEKITTTGSELASSDVTLIVDIVDRALDLPETMEDVAALEDTVKVFSNLLDTAQSTSVEDVAGRLLLAADKISREGQLSDGQLLLSTDNLVIAAQEVSPNFTQGILLSVDVTGPDEGFQEGDVTIQPSSPSAANNSLYLSRSLMTLGARVVMKVHRNSRVFEALKQPHRNTTTDESGYQTKINSYVISATIVGGNVTDLKDPIVYSLEHHDKNSCNARCVYWDALTNDWSRQGCSKLADRSNRYATTCQCNRLANFALLMDVYNHGVCLSETHIKALSFISYFGCSVSLLASLLTILIYCLFNPMSSKSTGYSGSHRSQRPCRKIRLDTPSKILVNLCAALALSNLVFVAGTQSYATGSDAGCKVVAVLLHFSLLSSLFWMLVEAFNLFLDIVLIFKRHFTYFILKCCLVGWGIPLLVVAVTLGINTDNYGYTTAGMCWLNGIAFYAAFAGPAGLILFANVVTFVMVMYRFSGLKRVQRSESASFSIKKRLRGAVGVTILLGLTWIFGFLAVSRHTAVVFYYLFTMFNCLQGLWIFLFYCVTKKEARGAWRSLCCCCPCCKTQQPRDGLLTTTERKEKIPRRSGADKPEEDKTCLEIPLQLVTTK